MIFVNGTNLAMPQGESEIIPLELTDEYGDQIPLREGDKVYMSVRLSKDKYLFEIVQDVFINGIANIEIKTEYTLNAKIANYKYDIRITFKEDPTEFITVIKESDFVLLEAVTKNVRN